MGGFGSGRGQSERQTTSDMRVLDVRRLHREGLLKPGQGFGWHWTRNGEKVANIHIRVEFDRLWLKYQTRSHRGESVPKEYAVDLQWTACHLGGQRAWFLCPAWRCGRRVAVLFGGSVFACRQCYRLAYECQREADDDRATRRAETLRRRLGWVPGILNGEGGKPKGMRWRTFERLKAQHDAFAKVSLNGISARLGWINRRLVGLGAEPLEDLGE